MSLRPAIIFTVILAFLLPYYLFVDNPELKRVALHQEQGSLLQLDGIDGITLTRGKESLRYQKTADGKRYHLVDPPDAFVPQDLMQAMVALLIKAKQVQIVADHPNDFSEFGLDNPRGTLVIKPSGDGEPIKLVFGSENPTHTAVYARIQDSPKVFLLGRNLEYYQTLMFQWVEGKQGKNA